MGALPRWLHLVGRLPARVVDALNAAARGPLGAVAKRLGGIAPERAIPPIARRPFTRARRPRAVGAGAAGDCSKVALHQTDWSRATLLQSRRPARRRAQPVAAEDRRPRILLWPDTFTNHFDPAVAADAVAVLEALGYAVELPPRTVCCALTWTTTGQVDAARRVLRRSLRTIEPWLAAGVPVVGLEPSCTAALRADGPELLPDEPLAARLADGVRTFAEVLAEHADALAAAVVAPGQRALVQVHCHQHAELGVEADQAAMAALGIEAEVLDSGCCGLAGNFGFEKGHYAVSMACAERVLLPAVRAAAPDVSVLADGFSCRTQLRQAGTREPAHLAQLAARAIGLG
jgi:Fe-S oxidoreductase